MLQKRHTAQGPRIPKPTKATRTVSIFGAVRPSTCCWSVGRSGVSITRVPLSQWIWVEGDSDCAWRPLIDSNIKTDNKSFFSFILLFFLPNKRLSGRGSVIDSFDLPAAWASFQKRQEGRIMNCRQTLSGLSTGCAVHQPVQHTPWHCFDIP